jgi:hypothetical protein
MVNEITLGTDDDVVPDQFGTYRRQWQMAVAIRWILRSFSG